MWYIEQQLALERTPNMRTRTPLYVTQTDEVMRAAKIAEKPRSPLPCENMAVEKDISTVPHPHPPPHEPSV